MTELLLARHGETDWNRDGRYQGHADPPLNELGRRQAVELADSLDGEPLDAICSSDLRRSLETAEIVGERLGLAVERDADLREIDVGSWQGLTRAEIAERSLDGTWDGETYEQHRGRVVAAVRRIAARHPVGRVLVVTHGGCLRRLQEAAFGRPEPVVGNCVVCRIAVEDGAIRRID